MLQRDNTYQCLKETKVVTGRAQPVTLLAGGVLLEGQIPRFGLEGKGLGQLLGLLLPWRLEGEQAESLWEDYGTTAGLHLLLPSSIRTEALLVEAVITLGPY